MVSLLIMAKNKIKIFYDGANEKDIIAFKKSKIVSGFTTNPTLLKNSGVKLYPEFAIKIAKIIFPKPISFEVLSDEEDKIYIEAKKINDWGKNIFVKIPIINSKGIKLDKVILKLVGEGVKCNVTAIYSFKQVKELVKKMENVNTKIILSVFCGRIADTGRSPLKILKEFNILKSTKYKNVDLLWASTREILNVYEAENAGCDIITVSKDILSKMTLRNKSLIEYSRETVSQFIKDAKSSGLKVC